MKRNFVTITIALSLFLCAQAIQVKDSARADERHKAALDQIELSKQFVGTWQHKVSNDTIEIWECTQYEKAYVSMAYRVIKGKKSFWYTNTMGFSSGLDKCKGFSVYSNGRSRTFLGSFISENKCVMEYVRNFNPEEVTSRFEVVFETPTNMVATFFNAEGEKRGVYKWYKDK